MISGYHLNRIFVILLMLILISCLGSRKKTIDRDNLILFPAPPATARIQYLTSFSNSTDITGQRSSFMRYILGDEPDKPIEKPYGLALHNGKIYICDTMLPGLEIVDLKNRTFEYFNPGGMGQLKKPLNCAVDSHGNLYVADVLRKQVVVFDSDGRFLQAIGNPDQGKPTDVMVYQDKIWISDLTAHQIKIYAMDDYRLLKTFPEVDKNRPYYLFSPTNLDGANGRIYVTDTGDSRVKIFTDKGDYVGTVGSFGQRPGQFVRPKGVALDKNGRIYVADAAFENVQIFNDEYQLLMFFGGKYDGPGYMWLPAGIAIDYDHLDYFREYLYPGFDLKYLIFVTNQYGPDRISVYGFVDPESE